MDGIRTGDALLFSSNTSTGFVVRVATSSLWNHGGVAVRAVFEGGRPRVTLDGSGRLYVLETNTQPRRDAFSGEVVVGAAFSEAEWVFARYNRVACRPLRAAHRRPALAAATLAFAARHRGRPFAADWRSVAGIWLGVGLRGADAGGMFCTELMAHFYLEALGLPSLEAVFGPGAPPECALATPEHYARPAPLFEPELRAVRVAHADAAAVALPPLLLALAALTAVALTLPAETEGASSAPP